LKGFFRKRKSVKMGKNAEKQKLEIIYRKISELIHPDYNPRQIKKEDFEQLKRSLSEFDSVEPAVINTASGRENIIVGGNQRIRAAEELGWQEFPCVSVCLELEREKELNVRLNRNTGSWDFDKLANGFDVSDLTDWGFEEWEFGMQQDELEEKKIPTIEPFKKTHILISLPTEKIHLIKQIIDQIKQLDFVETETASN